MAKSIIVANWKQNKTLDDAYDWLTELSIQGSEEREIVLCPSFMYLYPLQERIKALGLSISLGSQDFPAFSDGAHTGEEPVEALRGTVKYSIIGHSERKKYVHETDKDIVEKASLALKSSITPILCISDLAQLDNYLDVEPVIRENSEKIVFVYEPPSAISGGGEFRPENPDEVNKIASDILEKVGGKASVLYGGSINPDNAASFFSQAWISGGLVGQASLDPVSFSKICNLA